jgi:hypothetical protein
MASMSRRFAVIAAVMMLPNPSAAQGVAMHKKCVARQGEGDRRRYRDRRRA